MTDVAIEVSAASAVVCREGRRSEWTRLTTELFMQGGSYNWLFMHRHHLAVQTFLQWRWLL